MNRGYTKQYRKELDSDIWLMPPLYGRVWKWINLNVKWKKEVFPTPNGYGIHINPGQMILSYDIISRGVMWYEWGREKRPNKKTIKTILDWLSTQNMVTVVSNGKGTLLTVINWDIYQGVDSDKVTVESNAAVTQEKRLLETIKELQKNIKELKEDNKKKKPETKFCPVKFKPDFFTEKEWSDLLESRKAKKILNTEAALKPFINQIKIANENGITVRECLDEFIPSKWTRFKAEWMEKQNNTSGRGDQKSFDQMRTERNDAALREFGEGE